MKKVITILLIAAIAATSATALTACKSADKAEPTTAPTVAATQAAAAAQVDDGNNDSAASAVQNDNDSDNSYNADADADNDSSASSEWRSEEGNAMSKDVATQTLIAYSKEEYPGSTATSKGCMSFYAEDKGMYGYRVVLDIETAEGDVVTQGFLIYDDGMIDVE